MVRFGECCENDENYIICISMLLDVNDYWVLVCCYRFLGYRNILYFFIFLDKLDNDVYWFMMKVLIDLLDENVVVDLDLLIFVLINVKSSRLLCIIEIFF